MQQCAHVALVHPPRTLDIIAQQGFQNLDRRGAVLDLLDQFQQVAQALDGLLIEDSAQRELYQAGEDVAFDLGIGALGDVVQGVCELGNEGLQRCRQRLDHLVERACYLPFTLTMIDD